MKNLFAKTRKVDDPYAVYRSFYLPDWEWRVLKTYQSKEGEAKNQYARWYLAVKSPMTYGSWEYGDTYKTELFLEAKCYLIQSTPEWREYYG